MPKVSIIIPTYNCARYVTEAIDSVSHQTYNDLEIIVVDDGSTDDTLEKLKPYGNKLTIISQPNLGVSSARNVGIMQARGEWVAFLDADDYWEAEKLERQVDYVRQNPDVILVHTGKKLFGELGKRGHDETRLDLLRRSGDFRALLVHNFILTGSVMARKDILLEAGIFDTTLEKCEDYDLWLRIAKRGRLGYIPAPLFHYRIHKAQATSQADGWYEAGLKVIRKNRALVSSLPEYLAWRRGYAGRLLDAGYYQEKHGRRFKSLLYFMWSLWMWPFEGAFLKLKSMIRIILHSIWAR